jgi:hypothetical protein
MANVRVGVGLVVRGAAMATEPWFAGLLNRLRWCKERSPEGFRCKLRFGHDGLHVPHMGSGYAWGGSANSQVSSDK